MWADPAIAKMSHAERLLFIGMVTIADDEGRLPASASYLAGAIFPNDSQAPRSVRRWRDSVVEKAPNVLLYQHEGVDFISLARWERYQKPSHPTPSKLPKPSRRSAE